MFYFFEENALIAYILVCVCLIIIGTIKTKSHKVTFLVLSFVLCLYLSYVIELTQFPNTTSIQNIMMAMPLGLLVPLIRRGKMSTRAVLIMAVLFGIVLESLQLLQLLILGYTVGVVDINDVIFDFIGVMIGYLCFVLLRTITQRLCKRFDSWFEEQL